MSEKEPTVVIVDLTKAIEAGVGIKVGNDLTIGAVKTKEAPKPVKVQRKVEEYKGEPPKNINLKYHQEFEITEKCGLRDKSRQGKEYKCDQNLRVVRTKREYFEADNTGTGGQLQYDQDDVKQYKWCPVHGPEPPGPTNW